MTPVMQSKLYNDGAMHLGNCFAACVASILDLPLWMVPAFEEDKRGRGMHDMADQWARRLFGKQLTRTLEHDPAALPEFYIASGPSPRGVHHAVIYRRGALAHDPHPSGVMSQFD